MAGPGLYFWDAVHPGPWKTGRGLCVGPEPGYYVLSQQPVWCGLRASPPPAGQSELCVSLCRLPSLSFLQTPGAPAWGPQDTPKCPDPVCDLPTPVRPHCHPCGPLLGPKSRNLEFTFLLIQPGVSGNSERAPAEPENLCARPFCDASGLGPPRHHVLLTIPTPAA